jgi:hypothetical protein
MDLHNTIDANYNGKDDARFGNEMEESIEMIPTNLKENLEARLPNAPKSLESGDVGMTFRLKNLEFMDSMNY